MLPIEKGFSALRLEPFIIIKV